MTTILFQGDSITDMAHIESNTDLNHIYGHSFVFLLAAHLGAEHPEAEVKIINKGVSGSGLSDMIARWESDTALYRPDIISILIGINDIINQADTNGNDSSTEYKNKLQKLIDKIRLDLPETKIVICEPFGFPEAANKRYRNVFKAEIPLYASAAQQISYDNDLIFVPLRDEFENAYKAHPELGYKHWIWDGIHPTAAGHMLIARQWLKYVKPIQKIS